MNIPQIPFPNYKWRWASYVPSEGLNEPPVHLGVLRAFAAFEGRSATDPDLIRSLGRVQQETGTDCNLSGVKDRSLKRRHGQYWSALGLIEPTPGIQLTEFGRAVASGDIPPALYASTIVQTLTLPNLFIETSETVALWRDAGLVIQPLRLLLALLNSLGETAGEEHSRLSVEELTRLVIPLSGTGASIEQYVEVLLLYRQDKLVLDGWTDCTPRANDKRMAREFLLFLSHYGFVTMHKGRTNTEDMFSAAGTYNITPPGQDTTIVTPAPIRKSGDPLIAEVERQRVLVSILARPQQMRFRREVLDASSFRCLITGETLQDALEAAHIRPVRYRGSDHPANGLCLRADLHRLFDAGHLRLDVEGNVYLSEATQQSVSYSHLTRKISLPNYIDAAQIIWRWNYL